MVPSVDNGRYNRCRPSIEPRCGRAYRLVTRNLALIHRNVALVDTTDGVFMRLDKHDGNCATLQSGRPG